MNNRFFDTLQTKWDWRAAGNFMFGGTGSALLFMIAMLYFPATPPLLVGLAALAFVGLGLFCVWLEIGKPWRFINVFFHPQTSWMSREASVAMVLFPVAFFGLVFEISPLVSLGGVIGLVFLYCQARILIAAKGIPSWREPTLKPLIIGTGLVEGTGVLLLALALVGEQQGWLLFAMLLMLAFRLHTWNKYRDKLIKSEAPAKTLSVLGGIHPTTQWGGNIAPFILVALALLMPSASNLAAPLAGLLALLSGWHMKFTIITQAAQQQGYRLGTKLKKGRPIIKPPVRRKPDNFVW